MRIDDQNILAVLRLGHATLACGAGLSLHEEFTRSGYAKLAERIRRGRVVPLLRAHPVLLQQWIEYGQSKSRDRGYWVSPASFEVGSDEWPNAGITMFGSLEEAVAEFILRELACWSEAGQHRAASPVLPTADEIATALDHKRRADLGRSETRLFNDYGLEPLIPGLTAAFGKIRSWQGRNSILFWLIKFARIRPEVLELALAGLKDRAFLVRMQSCIMLAYSQRDDMIPHLEKALSHKDKKTREYAATAIEHIRNKTVFYDFQERCEILAERGAAADGGGI